MAVIEWTYHDGMHYGPGPSQIEPQELQGPEWYVPGMATLRGIREQRNEPRYDTLIRRHDPVVRRLGAVIALESCILFTLGIEDGYGISWMERMIFNEGFWAAQWQKIPGAEGPCMPLDFGGSVGMGMVMPYRARPTRCSDGRVVTAVVDSVETLDVLDGESEEAQEGQDGQTAPSGAMAAARSGRPRCAPFLRSCNQQPLQELCG